MTQQARYRNANRCTNTEVRNGHTVRCVMRTTRHQGCRNAGVYFTVGQDASVARMNEEPVCARSWMNTEDVQVREHWDLPWRDLVESVGHVCYETKDHPAGEHVCWCGEKAREPKR